MPRTIAMMQPYLFPYLGYFQLIAHSDVFVLGDDLQYVKASWINRNRILVNGQEKLITFPLKKADPYIAIGQRWLADDFEREGERLLRTFELSYARAPQCREVLPLLASILTHPERNLARFTEHSLRVLCRHLGIETPMLRGSEVLDTREMDKQERVIRLAQTLEGERYVNPIGGLALYCPQRFAEHGLELRFLRMGKVQYPQFKHPFVPALSIIDVLMFNPPERIAEFMGCFELIEGQPHAPTASRSDALPV